MENNASAWGGYFMFYFERCTLRAAIPGSTSKEYIAPDAAARSLPMIVATGCRCRAFTTEADHATTCASRHSRSRRRPRPTAGTSPACGTSSTWRSSRGRPVPSTNSPAGRRPRRLIRPHDTPTNGIHGPPGMILSEAGGGTHTLPDGGTALQRGGPPHGPCACRSKFCRSCKKRHAPLLYFCFAAPVPRYRRRRSCPSSLPASRRSSRLRRPPRAFMHGTFVAQPLHVLVGRISESSCP